MAVLSSHLCRETGNVHCVRIQRSPNEETRTTRLGDIHHICLSIEVIRIMEQLLLASEFPECMEETGPSRESGGVHKWAIQDCRLQGRQPRAGQCPHRQQTRQDRGGSHPDKNQGRSPLSKTSWQRSKPHLRKSAASRLTRNRRPRSAHEKQSQQAAQVWLGT